MPCEAIVTAWPSGPAKIYVHVVVFMELSSENLSAYLMIGTLLALVFGSLIYGIYMAFGAGSEQLTDQIEEHSRLHKLGIAHSHQGNGRAVARGGHSHHDHDVVKS